MDIKFDFLLMVFLIQYLTKEDKNSFIFNLNQNQIYKKKINFSSYAFYNKNDCGPSANGLGCNSGIQLNYIYYSFKSIDKYYENASKILPKETNMLTEENEIKYELNEMEIFQIIIE